MTNKYPQDVLLDKSDFNFLDFIYLVEQYILGSSPSNRKNIIQNWGKFHPYTRRGVLTIVLLQTSCLHAVYIPHQHMEQMDGRMEQNIPISPFNFHWRGYKYTLKMKGLTY